MARRRGESVLNALPWYVGAIIAIILFFAAPRLAAFVVQKLSISGKAQQLIPHLLRFLSYYIGVTAALSALRAYKVRKHFALQRSLDDLRALSWQQFEV